VAIFLKAQWRNIIMANYPVPETLLMPFLPKGVELDLFQGKAYVSLVGFMFQNIKLFNIPVPWFGNFEEINLRFYVKKTEGEIVKRGVVFISETAPYRAVAWLANKMYKEHYRVVSAQHTWLSKDNFKYIQYKWFLNNKWNSIDVKAFELKTKMLAGSFENFIFEHYYGYTKINATITEQYSIKHPSWMINAVVESKVSCDFDEMYGKEFGFLSSLQPEATFLAEGSSIQIDWKRSRV